MKLIIPGELTDLNTYINKERMNKFGGASVKKRNTEIVLWETKSQRIKKFTSPIFVSFNWYCKNKKKDKDNIAFAKKFILDGLVLAGIIKNDGWDDILGFSDSFFIDKDNPRIEIEIN